VAYILHDNQHILLTSRGRKFTEGDAFIGYQKDTPAAVVFQATQATPGRMEHISVPGTKADEEEEDVEESHIWKENVLKMNQYLLLQTASPDALVRLEHTLLADQREELLRLYFQEQHHNSVEDFLAHHIQKNSTRGGGLLMQVTTHSHLLSKDELDHIGRNLFSDPSHVHAFSLQEFDTELDFSNKVGYVYLVARTQLTSNGDKALHLLVMGFKLCWFKETKYSYSVLRFPIVGEYVLP